MRIYKNDNQYFEAKEGSLVVCIGVSHPKSRIYYTEGEVFKVKNGSLYAVEPRNYNQDQSFGGYDGFWAPYSPELKSYEEML